MGDVTQLVERYRRAYTELRASVEGLTGEQLSRKPSPEKWSIREIFQHLLDSELHTSLRIKKVLAEEKPRLSPFDQEEWARKLRYESMDPHAAVLAFGLLRELNGNLLALLTEEQWNRTGIHEERGTLSVRDLVQDAVEHGEAHLLQVRAIREAL
ncbi:MAG: hypothetical protein COS95_00145 [Ignavibacteriales bacterium CG07_land_8_20_14_0_80_59_12]|nr:MAG: hypothetical protein COS95_00145 [Ignavibacteriales bacterium CG07_land_8_20_14_0_80_59_12]